MTPHGPCVPLVRVCILLLPEPLHHGKSQPLVAGAQLRPIQIHYMRHLGCDGNWHLMLCTWTPSCPPAEGLSCAHITAGFHGQQACLVQINGTVRRALPSCKIFSDLVWVLTFCLLSKAVICIYLRTFVFASCAILGPWVMRGICSLNALPFLVLEASSPSSLCIAQVS